MEFSFQTMKSTKNNFGEATGNTPEFLTEKISSRSQTKNSSEKSTAEHENV